MKVDVEKVERELRAGLDGVTKGKWEAGSGWVFTDPEDRSPREPLRNILRDVPANEIQANCDFIEASQPENIRALLDELSRLREVERRATEDILAVYDECEGVAVPAVTEFGHQATYQQTEAYRETIRKLKARALSNRSQEGREP